MTKQDIPQIVASAAAQAAPGWTPGAYGIWVIVATIVGYIVRQYVPWFRANTEREKSATDVLQVLVDKLQARIDTLEHSLTDERRRCEEETRSLHDKIEALQRIIVQWQVSTGRMIEVGSAQTAPEGMKAMERVAQRYSGDDKP